MPKTLTLTHLLNVIPVDLVCPEKRCRLVEWRDRPAGARLTRDCRRGAVFGSTRTIRPGFGAGGWGTLTPPAAHSPPSAPPVTSSTAQRSRSPLKDRFVLVPSGPTAPSRGVFRNSNTENRCAEIRRRLCCPYRGEGGAGPESASSPRCSDNAVFAALRESISPSSRASLIAPL